jgi:hypothetical protein
MKKTQYSWIFIFALAIVFPVVFSDRMGNPVVIVASFILFLVLLLFFRLTVKVDRHFVHYIFGIGLIRGKYALENIEKCRPVRDTFLGWGIKYRPEVIIFNISGRYAIELKLRDDERKILIGTLKPEELSEFINSRLNKSGKN